MSWEENKEFTESKIRVEEEKHKPWWKSIFVIGIACFLLGAACAGAIGRTMLIAQSKRNAGLYARIHEEQQKVKEAERNIKTVYVTVPVPVTESIKASEEAAPVSDVPETETTENTYDNNEYYDVVETMFFKNSINDTVMINKVLAKKDVSVSGTVLAYAADGSVVGKSSDDIILTAGQYNYFRYSFDGDLTDVTLKTNYQAKKDSILAGLRNPNAVEMVDYNHSGNELYITFKQNVDKLDSFAKFKILFYNGDKIVETEDGYFHISAKNLNGNGATDVAKVWAYGINFDRIEYIYEP